MINEGNLEFEGQMRVKKNLHVAEDSVEADIKANHEEMRNFTAMESEINAICSKYGYSLEVGSVTALRKN